jgi:hypothetical protein
MERSSGHGHQQQQADQGQPEYRLSWSGEHGSTRSHQGPATPGLLGGVWAPPLCYW